MPIKTVDLNQVSKSFLRESADQWLNSEHCLDINCSSGEDFIESNFKNNANNPIVKIAVNSSTHGNWLIGLKLLDWDSNHFDFKIARLTPFIIPDCHPADAEARAIGASLLNDLLNHADQLDIKHLTVLIHPQDSLGIQLLGCHGFQLMDTTVMYELDLNKADYQFKTADQIRIAKMDDLEAIQKIAIDCFANRKNNINRFNSDPSFPGEKVESLYSNWIANSISGDMADQLYVLETENRIAGFLSVQESKKSLYGSAENALQIPINAVSPEFRGRGFYRMLVEHAITIAKESGTSKVEIWTHVSNSAVHKVWQRFGANICLSGHQFRRCQEKL